MYYKLECLRGIYWLRPLPPSAAEEQLVQEEQVELCDKVLHEQPTAQSIRLLGFTHLVKQHLWKQRLFP